MKEAFLLSRGSLNQGHAWKTKRHFVRPSVQVLSGVSECSLPSMHPRLLLAVQLAGWFPVARAAAAGEANRRVTRARLQVRRAPAESARSTGGEGGRAGWLEQQQIL